MIIAINRSNLKIIDKYGINVFCKGCKNHYINSTYMGNALSKCGIISMNIKLFNIFNIDSYRICMYKIL
jgi:hypothetical protein